MKTKGARIAMKNFTKPKRHQPILRFSPTAWAKLLFLRDAGDTEVCGFGIAAADDLLFVEDIVLVNQVCTWITAELDDASVADFFDSQDAHPSNSLGSSSTPTLEVPPSPAAPMKIRSPVCSRRGTLVGRTRVECA
jgi:hypothetical protein